MSAGFSADSSHGAMFSCLPPAENGMAFLFLNMSASTINEHS